MTITQSEDLTVATVQDDPVATDEVLSMILAQESSRLSPTARQVDQFRESIAIQGMRISPAIRTTIGRRPITAAAVIASPGKTGLLMLAGRTEPAINRAAMTMTINAVCREAWNGEIDLLQVLMQPNDPLSLILTDAGFTYLTELVYLEAPAARSPSPGRRVAPLQFLTYSDARRPQFVEVLKQTYVDSLDCPGLNGLRDPNDTLVGHRHTGIFHKHLWLLAVERDEPVGVLLLSEVPNRSTLEIAYVGVVPSARGRRIGDAMVRQAIQVAWEEKKSHVTLAVDHTNTFACELYRRWGFVHLARRRAWIMPRPS